jgi:hypothetical protein
MLTQTIMMMMKLSFYYSLLLFNLIIKKALFFSIYSKMLLFESFKKQQQKQLKQRRKSCSQVYKSQIIEYIMRFLLFVFYYVKVINIHNEFSFISSYIFSLTLGIYSLLKFYFFSPLYLHVFYTCNKKK